MIVNVKANTNPAQRITRKGFGYKPFEGYGIGEQLVEAFARTHKKRKLIVKEVLETWDAATNNDRLMDFECLRVEFPEIQVTSSKENIIFKFPRKIIQFMPSPESYTRARRSLNTQGIGLPTNDLVFLKRMKRQRTMRQYFKKDGQ